MILLYFRRNPVVSVRYPGFQVDNDFDLDKKMTPIRRQSSLVDLTERAFIYSTV